jgi:acetyltransferase-like isoleucine patch superfamily enzyme
MVISFLKYIYRYFIPIKKKEELFYTVDYFKHKDYKIGIGTYGNPRVLDWKDGTTLEIGNYCSISINVTILLGGEHNYNCISTYPFYTLSNVEKLNGQDRNSKGSVIIGHDVWIGANVTILSGVKIGNGAIVGAGSVVTKNIPEFAIYGGNPAKLIKSRFNDKKITEINKTEWWNWSRSKIEKNRNLLMNPKM